MSFFDMKIFKIKDSYLVLKGDRVLPEECVRAQNLLFEDYEMVNGATYKSFDAEKSLLLGLELPRSEYNLLPKEYRNELKDDKNQRDVKNKYSGYEFIYPDFTVSDDEILPIIKQIGIKLYNKCDVYKLKYNAEQKSFVLTDERGKICNCRGTNAETDRNSITMYTEMYGFEKSDYLRLKGLYAKLGKKSKDEQKVLINSLSARDVALIQAWNFVLQRVSDTKKQKPYTLRHEITHIRNRYCMNSHNLDGKRGKLSVENYFRLSQYDEKSAHLAENLLAIKNYVNNGDWNDFSMFPNKSKWLVEKLKPLSENGKKQALTNYKMIVEGTFKYWDSVHTDGYMLQFANIVGKWARKSPISFMGDDEDEYKKRRKDMFTFKVIDPVSKQESRVDFSQFIDNDIPITDRVEKIVINPAKEKIKARKERLIKSGVTRADVEMAQKYHWRDNVVKMQPQGRGGR